MKLKRRCYICKKIFYCRPSESCKDTYKSILCSCYKCSLSYFEEEVDKNFKEPYHHCFYYDKEARLKYVLSEL